MKCVSCGTTFMSETGTTMCPSCSERTSNHRGDDSSSMMGCGCGHSH